MSADFHSPSIAYGALTPILIPAGRGDRRRAGRRVRARRSRGGGRRRSSRWLGLVGALVAVARARGQPPHHRRHGAISVDGPTLFLQGTIAVLGIASVLLVADRSPGLDGGAFVAQAATRPGSADERASGAAAGHMQTEVFPLMMFAVTGMMLFPASNDLLLLFVALEVLSLPLYLLCGLARRRRLLSQEAAVKYFLLGAFSSAFFLYGLALLYGYAGTHLARRDPRRGDHRPAQRQPAVPRAGVCSRSACCSRSAPRRSTPGSPTSTRARRRRSPRSWRRRPRSPASVPCSGSSTSRSAGSAGSGGRSRGAVAILTMVVGSIFAITQTDVKRMLAYSSVAHAGFILIGVIALNKSGLSGSMFYLLTYGITTIGAFGILTLIRDPDGEATHLSRWAGLGRRSPLVGGRLRAVPAGAGRDPADVRASPASSRCSRRASSGGATPLVIVGVITSAMAAFFYVRVIVMMFFAEPVEDGPVVVDAGWRRPPARSRSRSR